MLLLSTFVWDWHPGKVVESYWKSKWWLLSIIAIEKNMLVSLLMFRKTSKKIMTGTWGEQFWKGIASTTIYERSNTEFAGLPKGIWGGYWWLLLILLNNTNQVIQSDLFFTRICVEKRGFVIKRDLHRTALKSCRKLWANNGKKLKSVKEFRQRKQQLRNGSQIYGYVPSKYLGCLFSIILFVLVLQIGSTRLPSNSCKLRFSAGFPTQNGTICWRPLVGRG